MFNTLSHIELKMLSIKKLSKGNNILPTWATIPMLDKAIFFLNLYEFFRYVIIILS